MDQLVFRNLKHEECVRINEMDPTQYVKNAWRDVDGSRQLISIDYLDSDWPNGYEYHFEHLEQTILSGGFALGAFCNDSLVAFVTLNLPLFGTDYQYVLLDQLFVSLEYRNRGLGKKLFLASTEIAKMWGANKLYICAGSAEETIAFYFGLGCVESVEINQELYDIDPNDYQLELSLSA